MSVGIWAASRTEWAGRPRHLFARLLVLAALAQALGLPMFDPSVVDFSPWHTHVVLGAANAEEAAWALAHHDHAYDRQPASPKTTVTHGRLRVVSLDAGRVLAATWAIDLTTAPLPGLLDPGAPLWRASTAQGTGPAWPRGAPPLPPPRHS